MRTLLALAALTAAAQAQPLIIDDFADAAFTAGPSVVTEGVGDLNARRTILVNETGAARGTLNISGGELEFTRSLGVGLINYQLRYDWTSPQDWRDPPGPANQSVFVLDMAGSTSNHPQSSTLTNGNTPAEYYFSLWNNELANGEDPYWRTYGNPDWDNVRSITVELYYDVAQDDWTWNATARRVLVSTPEPTSLGLVLLGGVLIVCRGR